MKSIILAIVRSPRLRDALLKISDRLFSSLEFGETLQDYSSSARTKHVGLRIIEYDLIRYLSDEERIHFYKKDCPTIILTQVGSEHYAFSVSPYIQLNSKHDSGTEEIARIINRNYQPLSSGSLYSKGEGIQFVSRNPKMLEIFQSAKKVAQFNTHVLLLGESGTGKDVLAQLIHAFSKRNERNMVKVNCAAIPGDLLETEMFGYRKGAFTNAYEDKRGKIQLANGSTLFLDEIGELDLPLQAKLLRVIETGEVDIIGGIEPVKVDIRLISATNQNLRKSVEMKRFREDLYYRLNVVNFQLIPLRDRPEDIPLLFEHFLSFFCKKYNKRINNRRPESLKDLYEYAWPGNVREFRNFMERLVVQTYAAEIDTDLMRHEIENLTRQQQSNHGAGDLAAYLENEEKQHILRTLSENNYKILATARELGISRISMFRKLKKHGIEVMNLKNRKGPH
ncbi:MAG: sigma-54 dependent transcriptional regulator [Calditrichia bacterium]